MIFIRVPKYSFYVKPGNWLAQSEDSNVFSIEHSQGVVGKPRWDCKYYYVKEDCLPKLWRLFYL